MSKTRKLFLVLLAFCFAVALSLSVGVVSFAEGETAVSVSAVKTEPSPFAGNGFTMRVSVTTNATDLGNGLENLSYTGGTQKGLTYARGNASSEVGAIHGGGANVILYFRNPSGATFTSGVSEKGDVLTIPKGFTFTNKSKVSYIVEETLAFEFDGTEWKETEVLTGTQISWPAMFTAADWSSDTELRLPSTGLKNNNQGALTYDASMLGLVKITRGDNTYACSNIYEWGGELTFYFNGSKYTGKTPQDGDVLSVGAGLKVSNKENTEYINKGAVSWTYSEEDSCWIREGAEPPAQLEPIEIESITVKDVVNTNNDTALFVNTTSTNTANFGDTDYVATNIKNYITVTFPSGTQSSPWYCRVNGRVARFFIRPEGATSGNINSGESFPLGTVITIKAGFAILPNEPGVAEDVSFVYDGYEWLKGNKLPEEDISALDPIEIESITLTGKYSDSPFFINTTSTNTENFGDADYSATKIRRYIIFTYPSGKQVIPWYVRVDANVARLFIRQEGSTSANINNGQIPVGSIMTIKAGFRILATEALQEDISFVFTGKEWIEGTEIPDVTAEFAYAVTEISAFAGNGYTMRVDVATNADDLGASGNLDYDSGMADLITYTRGTASATAGVIHRDGSNMSIYFKNPTGVEFTNGVSLEGDILTIKSGFEFRDVNGITYVVSKDTAFRFDGGAWVKAENGEYPKLVTVVATGAETNSNGNSSYPIVVAVNTNAEALGGFIDMKLNANQLAQASYTRDGVTVNAVYVYSHGKNVLFWFKGTQGMTLKEDSPEPGDVLTVTSSFRFVSNDNAHKDEYYKFEGTVKYMFNGVSWITPLEMPDRDYESLTPITVDSITTTAPSGSEADTVFYIKTTSSNTQVFENSNYNDVYVVLPYISFVYPNGNIADVWCARVSGNVIRLYIHEPGSQTNIGLRTIPEGGVLTVYAGFGILATEALQEDVSYVYNGTKFVPLVEPDSADDYTIETAADTHIKVGQDLKIEVKLAEGITAYCKYSVDNSQLATISPLGVLRGLKAGTVTVSVWYGDLAVKTVRIVIDPLVKEDIQDFSIETQIDKFIIPVADGYDGEGNYFWETVVEKGGYVFNGKYTLASGVVVNVEITESMIGNADFTDVGNHALIITDPLSEKTFELEIEVIEPREVGTFSSLGVDGYDVDDSRNASGTWNGHMIVGMESFSTNTRNMTGNNSAELAALKDMANYIVYERADGTVYKNTFDDDGNAVDTPISLWQLSSRYLILIRPEGYSGTKGYGKITTKDENGVEHTVNIPIYQEGDKITFTVGMPAYKFIGNDDKTEGYYIVEGLRAKEITYYCYRDDGERSLWQLYIEYTDFTVSESMEIEVNEAKPVGAVRVPADATTGTFAFVSSNPGVVTINNMGTMVGISTGTATITITLTGGKDADGNDLAPITKTVQVTVVRGISKVEGSIEVRQGAELDLSQYSVTVTYTDGTTENIKLNDERVVMQPISTEEVGSLTYNVTVTLGGTPVRGTLTVNVVAGGGCSSAVGAAAAGVAAAVVLLAGALLFIRKKKLG